MVEIVTPFTLEEKQVGLIRLGLSTAGLADVTRQAQRGILWYSLGLLAVGVLGAVVIFWAQARHLAERRRLEAAVVHEQRLSAMGNLAAGVAHEIKNPLNAISIGVQRLRMEFAPAAPEACEEYVRFTRIVEAEVSRLDAIVNQFSLWPGRCAGRWPTSRWPRCSKGAHLLSPQAAAQGVILAEDLQLEGRGRRSIGSATHPGNHERSAERHPGDARRARSPFAPMSLRPQGAQPSAARSPAS
jgi:signal transduction histidine kinase